MTLVNIGVMGLYDVVAFSQTRSRAVERWRYGAVAFAWSNFLTLGPLAGPAIRFWLYRPAVEHPSDLETRRAVDRDRVHVGARRAGRWRPRAAAARAGRCTRRCWPSAAFALVYAARRRAGASSPCASSGSTTLDPSPRAALGPALIGWLDWLLAAVAFAACLRATGVVVPLVESIRSFFFGQAIGLASLVPGGFGSSDAFWIAHLPLAERRRDRGAASPTGSSTTSCRGRRRRSCCCRGRRAARRAASSSRAAWWPGSSAPAGR